MNDVQVIIWSSVKKKGIIKDNAALLNFQGQ